MVSFMTRAPPVELMNRYLLNPSVAIDLVAGGALDSGKMGCAGSAWRRRATRALSGTRRRKYSTLRWLHSCPACSGRVSRSRGCCPRSSGARTGRCRATKRTIARGPVQCLVRGSRRPCCAGRAPPRRRTPAAIRRRSRIGPAWNAWGPHPVSTGRLSIAAASVDCKHLGALFDKYNKLSLIS